MHACCYRCKIYCVQTMSGTCTNLSSICTYHVTSKQSRHCMLNSPGTSHVSDTCNMSACEKMGMLTQAQACGGYSAPELQKLWTEQCSSSLQQRKENAQELIASTQALLDKQGAAWKAACAAIGQLLTQLSEAHDRHKEGHTALTTGIMKSLETTKQVLKVTSEAKCCPLLCSECIAKCVWGCVQVHADYSAVFLSLTQCTDL